MVFRKRDCSCDGCGDDLQLSGVAPASDPLEREADQVAAEVTGNPPAAGQPGGDDAAAGADEADYELTADHDPLVVQRKAAGPGSAGPARGDVLSQIRSARPGGRALPAATRGYFEGRFGADFGPVRVHADEQADQLSRSLGAQAFTVGADIFFRAGHYQPGTPAGQSLLAHELTHTVQQGADGHPGPAAGRGAGPGAAGIQGHADRQPVSRSPLAVQRQPARAKPARAPAETDMIEFSVAVPADVKTIDEVFRLYEQVAYGHATYSSWECGGGNCDVARRRGRTVTFYVARGNLEAISDPDTEERKKKAVKELAGKSGAEKETITREVDKRYAKLTGDKPGKKLAKSAEGKKRTWENELAEVLDEGTKLEELPPAIKTLMTGKGKVYSPKDYQHLLRIADKLAKLSPEDLAAFKLLAVRATDNVDLFEKSVDMFIARKAELVKALQEQQQQQQQKQQPAKADDTLQAAFDEKWRGLDEQAVATMSEGERYALARQMTAEMTAAQLKYMKDHPGQTLKDFAKSATLLNTPETFKGIGQDLAEAANGDANSWARWAAGTGAGSKLSGWLLAVAGVIYVASWLTGVGELATIAAAAEVLLASTLTLSAVEAELRIKAASQATDPAEFKRNVQAAAAAEANIIVSVASIAVAAALHFVAKAAFPKTMQNISRSLASFRERIRLKGSVYALKPSIVSEMGARRAELISTCDAAKAQATALSKEVAGLSMDQFVDRLESGNGDLLDQTKAPEEQRVDYRALTKFKEGRDAIAEYQQKLADSLASDVPSQIDSLQQNYVARIDEFLAEVDVALTHEELGTAVDKLEPVLTEQRMKDFMRGQQDQLTRQKLAEAQAAMQQKGLRLQQENAAQQASQPPAQPPAGRSAAARPPAATQPARTPPAPTRPARTQPAAAEPKPAEPKPAEPRAAEPKAAQPVSAGPLPDQPKTDQPGPAPAAPDQPKADQPGQAPAAPEQPKAAEPVPAGPAPDQPKADQPGQAPAAPEQPKAAEPVPAGPAPEQPKADQPGPDLAKPAEPAPAEPAPAAPKSAEPKPAEPVTDPNAQPVTDPDAKPAPAEAASEAIKAELNSKIEATETELSAAREVRGKLSELNKKALAQHDLVSRLDRELQRTSDPAKKAELNKLRNAALKDRAAAGDELKAYRKQHDIEKDSDLDAQISGLVADLDGLKDALNPKPSVGVDETQPLGGRWYDVPTQGGEVNHMPADAANPHLSFGKGPSIRMDILDHYRTNSWGSSKAAQAWRARQASLISQGKFLDALAMDIVDVRGKTGAKYEKGIQQMLDYVERSPEVRALSKNSTLKVSDLRVPSGTAQ